MITETWREWLYPIGYIAQLAFGLRFLQQWIASEKQGQSIITKSFWIISLVGNLLLLLHAFIQLQFHLCVIQVCNAVISWRNLNLMQTKKSPLRFSSVVSLMIGLIFCSTLLFLIQGQLRHDGVVEWFRLPSWQGEKVSSPSLLWHSIGFLGMALFASRFWVQWLSAERKHQSYLGPAFWWLSLIGALLTIVYAVRIHDPVNIIGPATGLIPYIRNLMLIAKSSKVATEKK